MTMKKYLLITLLVVLSFPDLYSQSLDRLQALNAKSKVQYVTPEALDQLLIELRQYEKDPINGQDTILLDTYRSVISAYMANNHFKQAYDVYSRYLDYKENMLSEDKKTSINNAIASVSIRQQKDEKEKADLETKLNQLKEENDGFTSKRIGFKRYFSFGLIVLSSIFAIMLVSAGIRMISLRSKLRQSRDKMKNIHRIALAGELENGLTLSMRNSLKSIYDQTKEVQQLLKKQELNSNPVKQANQVIAGIDKIYKEVLDKF
jgi:hypothetical protein